jgi:inner membrane protein
VTVHPALSPDRPTYAFTAELTLNGSEHLQFIPVGKQTLVKVTSPWSDRSCVGRYLPEQRTVDAAGFSAHWKILQINRSFAQHWTGAPGMDPHVADFAFGVRLLQPVDEYQKTMRSAKYAIMFISLTFLAFFLTEIFNKKTLHPIQYALIGFALVLFYCMLLSLSEHISFNLAYLASSASIIALVAGYARSVLGSKRFAAIVSGVMALLYGFLFIILQLEDYALLFGSLGLFGILALVMYLTRQIDWFSVGKEPRSGGKRLSTF